MPYGRKTRVRLVLIIYYDFCSRGSNSKPLSFHGVSFGPQSSQSLPKMAKIAREVENTVPADPASPVVQSSSAEALHTVSFLLDFHFQILSFLIIALYVRLTWPRHFLVWRSLSESLGAHCFEVEAQFVQNDISSGMWLFSEL